MKSDLNPEGPRSTTADAVLGMLSLKPMTGYEIRNMIAASIGNFWSESFGQIYPTLRRLEAEGLVAELAATGHANDARAKRRFRLTATGRERLADWAAVPARAQVPRNELLLKLFFGTESTPERARAQLEAARAGYLADLRRYEGIAAEMERQHAANPGMPYWRMTVRYGAAEKEALVAWADECLAELDRLEEAAGAVAGDAIELKDEEPRGENHAR